MKRKISTSAGVSEVLQQGSLKKIGDFYYFAAMYSGSQRISEMTTGYALPKCGSFEEAEKFLDSQPEGRINQVMAFTKNQMEQNEIPFPLNEMED